MSLPSDLVIKIDDAKINHIKSISPSGYISALKCPLSFILRKSKLWQYNAQSASAVVGTVIHELIEWSGRNHSHEVTLEQANEKFDELIIEAEKKLNEHPLNCRLVPLSVSDPRFPEKKHSAIKAAVRGPKYSKFDSSKDLSVTTRYMYEEGFSSKNGLIYGEIDKIVDGPTGLAIYDKKTCQVIDEYGGIKPEYRMQLLLYAGIVFEDIGKMADRLILVDRDNNEVSIHFLPNEVLDVLLDASSWLVSINRKIATSESISKLITLARPSADACRYCSARSACSAYWGARQTLNDDWPIDVELVINSITQLGNGGKLIQTDATYRGMSVKVSPQDIEYQPAMLKIEKGKKIRLLNARKIGNQYSLTKSSVIYILSE